MAHEQHLECLIDDWVVYTFGPQHRGQFHDGQPYRVLDIRTTPKPRGQLGTFRVFHMKDDRGKMNGLAERCFGYVLKAEEAVLAELLYV